MANPSNDNFQRAMAALQAGKIEEAERGFRAQLKAQPKHVGALNLLGIILIQQGKFAQAEEFVQRALKENATSDATFYNYGVILIALNRPEEALQRFDQSLAINPKYATAHCNRAITLAELKRYDQALAAFDSTLALDPNLAVAWLGRGNVLSALERFADAQVSYDRALALNGNLAEAWLGRGNTLTQDRRYDEAFEAYSRALTIKSDLAEAWLGRGNVLVRFHRHTGAAAAFERALAIKPGLAEAWLEQGNNFAEIDNFEAAAAAYDKALALAPNLAKAWFGRAALLSKRKLYTEALVAYDKALAIQPDFVRADCGRLLIKQFLCDWSDFDPAVARLRAVIRAQKLISSPFANLSLPISAADQFQAAKCYAADQPSYPARWRGERYAHDRIRVAYISSDLRDHPVGRQMAEVFERHDQSRFEMTAISTGVVQESETRSRIKTAFEHFVDAQAMEDDQIAEYIHRHQIDIAVDLNGFTDGGRQGVFAQRPAPVQVNYLGYAGTLGADYYDYILADSTAIPTEQFQYYCEKVAWLPDSFMATESNRPISATIPQRSECGLPVSGFVFCCFNAAYKFSLELFSIWMKLLGAVAGSVLWLTDPGENARANLRREAEQAGVSGGRLIFATRMPSLADHLARHQLADLFLDTLPYNAHATAVDALWAGLPVLTCLGETFPGRVAGSLLKAVGMPELIAGSLAEYQALALKLARDPALLAALKAKLAGQRETFPLFDSGHFTRNLEAAYSAMVKRHRSGQGPAHFAVEAAE